jgi:hypothetical protein
MSKQMRVKRHKNRNAYLLTSAGLWARDFTKSSVPFLDINEIVNPSDYTLFLKNETANQRMNLPDIDSESLFHPNVVIVSDGYDFKERQKLLAQLPDKVTIIGVNGALAKWEMVSGDIRRRMDMYVVNNPYAECMRYAPRKTRYYPKCISSSRTNTEFIRLYSQRGSTYVYAPTPSESFSGSTGSASYCIDDYRNPVCAAIGLAYRFGVQKLMLFCCDDSFVDERPGATLLTNGLYQYPQQEISHGAIDGNLYWLQQQEFDEVQVGDCSMGQKYENVPYIEPDRVKAFFEG